MHFNTNAACALTVLALALPTTIASPLAAVAARAAPITQWSVYEGTLNSDQFSVVFENSCGNSDSEGASVTITDIDNQGDFAYTASIAGLKKWFTIVPSRDFSTASWLPYTVDIDTGKFSNCGGDGLTMNYADQHYKVASDDRCVNEKNETSYGWWCKVELYPI